LRNSLLNNFSPIGDREDRGLLLENFVYLRMRAVVDGELIKYWRTQNKQEVDFVVQKDSQTTFACEVKYQGSAYKESKYTYFKTIYPDIPLTCISLDNVIESQFHTVALQ
jgi:predicted AAA+ superfamily ATPase